MSTNYKELKKGGFMRQRQPNYFSMRLKSVGGHFTAEQLDTIQNVAKKFGKGYIHLTSRQGIEIPFIHLNDVDAVKKFLSEGGVQVGVCGARVRTITACQGNAICPSGLIDTVHLAKEFDKRYGGRELPHKFKFGFTGCRNNCLKAEENDMGVKGGVKPAWKSETCTFCGLCQAVCPQKTITVDKISRSVTFDENNCLYCGKCIKSCPSDAWQGESGFIISFGGLYGNRIAVGENFLPIVFDEEKLYSIVDATLKFFADNAKSGERFRNMLDRVGWEKFSDVITEVAK
ncbi:MAG: 4Fe-4S binding protein [Selenomonadaceae bacterium]|nr:4Fe-4S binding protein [Selenomonadaceae bacterium]